MNGFRASRPEDASALTRLLASVFDSGPDSSLLDPQMMWWKYWAPRGDFDGPRSYVIEKGGEIKAHAGLWPVRFDLGGDAMSGVQMLDWAGARDSPGSGLALVGRLTRMFDFIYSIGGGDATQRVLPAFGFREIARVWTAARPLRPVSQMLTHQRRNWRLAPRLARNWIWSRGAARVAGQGWEATEISASAVEPTAGPSSSRPVAFFEYLAACPRVRFRLFAILRGSRKYGYFAIGVTRGQAKVGGVWLSSASIDDWQAAYQLAQQVAVGLPGANEIVARGAMGHSGQAATAAGLRILSEAPVLLLNRSPRMQFPSDFQFQLVDDDAGFLDMGRADYLT